MIINTTKCNQALRIMALYSCCNHCATYTSVLFSGNYLQYSVICYVGFRWTNRWSLLHVLTLTFEYQSAAGSMAFTSCKIMHPLMFEVIAYKANTVNLLPCNLLHQYTNNALLPRWHSFEYRSSYRAR